MKMVAPINPLREEMMEKLKETKTYSNRIDEIVGQGIISRRFGEYSKQLLMLDFLAVEAETLVRYGYSDSAIRSLTEMRFKLDSVAEIFMSDGDLETEQVEGKSFINNPNLDNVEKYRELYDFAQQKYEDAVTKCSKLLEAVA